MKLHKVSVRYGAPMGRVSYHMTTSAKLYVSRVRLDSGGYDSGGAYWGHGSPVYAASDTLVGDTPESAVFMTVRAKDRATAKAHFAKMFPACTFYK